MDTNDFKSFNYKSKLLGNTEADGANEILTNTAIAMSLIYLSNFWRSLDMPLLKGKMELELKCMNHCVLSGNGNDNDDVNLT